MIIKIIKSQPDTRERLEQDHINHLIGNTYEVLNYDKDDNSVSIFDSSFGGEIVLNEKEYQIIDSY
ncbi:MULTISPECIES: hypothetical protein [Bacillus subtilis group]|uniref:hypothetical protein n=1 Tax=Bacillus subtilis group TaxID=653685 RepID=UPI001F25C0A9|nr:MULTISPECIES: hypothetical protein [Bacillus subtilis group]MCF7618629.1 hypothetical protein [Bacillus sonorensis]MCJ8223656.1 hypothetical protein [Bacillus paralicheniformis]MCY7858855.1 hypothetical protein [Bacillus sonorensis]MCY8034076.1 hypothetical protein [Bacillus sonorensis]MCY8565619.1 hypothetical protein [Bacillus sonorensis]